MQENKPIRVFDLEIFPLKYQKIIKVNDYRMEVFEDYLDYFHYIKVEVADDFEEDQDGNMKKDEFGDYIVKKWKIMPIFMNLTIKKSNIAEIKIEWDEDDMIFQLNIYSSSGNVLEILFKKREDYKEIHNFLKSWLLNK